MKKKKRIYLAVICSMISPLFLLPTAAKANDFTTEPTFFDDIVLGVGTDQTQKNLNWYSTLNISGAVDYAPIENMTRGAFPTEYETANATVSAAKVKSGYYINRATITGLKENTEYVYRLRAGNAVSNLYRFETGSFGDYELIFAGDPQVKSEAHGDMWADTLNKINHEYQAFENAELLVSAGDQVGTNGKNVATDEAEEHWSNFFADELAEITFAPTAGPAHDIQSGDKIFSSYAERFYRPNASDKYAVTTSDSSYWYVYNNTLFMHLNVAKGANAAEDHKQFIIEAMQANPDVSWKIVVMHYPFFSCGGHSNPEHQYYEFVAKKPREALAPIFTELGIDIVLSGHDHVYTRSHIINGTEVSDDVVTDNTVKDPSGPLYLTAGCSSGTQCLKRTLDYDGAPYAALINDELRKSVVHFSVTDESITLKAYYIDGDEPELFDTFTINKTPHTHTPKEIEAKKPTCTEGGNNAYFYCEGCGEYYKDASCILKTSPQKEEIAKTGHSFAPSTCTTPQICTTEGCGTVKGTPREHYAQDANCTEGSFCKICSEPLSDALGHTFSNACDASCDRKECTYTRSVPDHIDLDDDWLCDECSANLKDSQSGKNDKRGALIGISAAIAVMGAGAAAIAALIIKKKCKNPS